MNAYVPVLALHVVVAVVGVGLFGAIPIVAGYARRAGVAPAERAGPLEPLFRSTRWSLAAIAVTGVLLEGASGGAFHESGWFRTSFALLVFLGFSHARARAALRAGLAAAAGPERALRRVERWGWTMCVTVASIAVLMEAKPF